VLYVFSWKLSISFSIVYPAILNQKKVEISSRKIRKSLVKQFLEVALFQNSFVQVLGLLSFYR